MKITKSRSGYGWWVDFGKRLRWSSTGATSRMWTVRFGADEHCNRAITFILWPLGHLDFWWEPRWRTEMCDDCKAVYTHYGLCLDCGARPCYCPRDQASVAEMV